MVLVGMAHITATVSALVIGHRALSKCAERQP